MVQDGIISEWFKNLIKPKLQGDGWLCEEYSVLIDYLQVI